MRRAEQAAREGQVHQRVDRADAVRVLREPHRPDEYGVRFVAEQSGEPVHVVLARAALRFDVAPRSCPHRVEHGREALGVRRHELVVDAVHPVERLQGADKECEVAARVHGEPVGRQPRAEDRALDDRRDPVPLQPGLAHRIDDGDLGAPLPGVIEVLHRDGLVVRRVRPEEHDEVGAQPVGIAARRGAVAERRLHRDGGRRVAEPGRIVDVRAAVRARSLLGRVVDLVGEAARREIERGARRIDGAEPGSGDVDRLVPGDRPESSVARAAHERDRQAAEPP